MEFDRVDVGVGDGGMKVDKMGSEGRTKGSKRKWRRWIADDMASEDMESNTAGGHLSGGKPGVLVFSRSRIWLLMVLVHVVAVVVVIVVASG